eukprot:TRINITY_DN80726_c0_g1_i1.p1 TRINITY_DN80726_c0_g1~~TRINITY_DN80726_c0_g1_i1.p1  ORF type:complete len:425 (-),score=58.12 TRINITY_DN80726_c0_g1_i1:42-1316(-)
MLRSGQNESLAGDGSVLRASLASRCSEESDFVRALSGESSPDAEEASHAEIAAWCLTGMSGWWSLNIIQAELPYFVAEMPQGQRLGNLLAVCTQLGNIAPIVYKALTRHRPGNLVAVIACFHAVGVAALVVCSFFWESLGVLLLCTSVAGSAGCMSSVTYWAAASGRPPACLRAMSVGMTFGGLLATGFSALQLAGRERGHPRFPPAVFFLLAAVMQALQGGAFLARSWSSSRRQSSQAESQPGNEASAANKVPLPGQAKALMAGCFLVYGATYTMPTLQPFMAGGYSSATERQQLLLWMLALQNTGDVLGRMATALIRSRGVILAAWLLLLSVSFLACLLAALFRESVATMLGYRTAIFLFPVICGVYYFSRGLLVTTFYLCAQQLGDKALVHRLSVSMGFWGQMGALLANAVAFATVSLFVR